MYQKDYWELTRPRRQPNYKVIEAFVRPKIDLIEREIGDLSKYKLLEVGCGNGFFTYYFENKLYSVGLDYSQFMLSINPSKIKVQGSALELPFKDKKFDIVFSSNLLHHLETPLLAVREMARVSKKFIILIEPNRNNPLMFMYCFLKNKERLGMKFSLSYLKKFIVKANCMPLVETTLGLILPNMTPSFILPLLKLVREENPYGFYNLLIAKV